MLRSLPRAPWALPRTPLALLLLVALFAWTLVATTPAHASVGTLTGVAFHDHDRTGSFDAGDDPLVDQLLYLYDADGTYLRNTRTGADGRYAFASLADGTYEVAYAPRAWWDLWNDHVPTTTDTLRPRHRVHVVGGEAVADFGWRAIVRSRDLAAPISSYDAPDGLRVHSYNDVVSAREVYDRLQLGSLVGGDEAPHTIVRHDDGSGTGCATGVRRTDGVWHDFRSSCNVAWNSWLTGADRSLFHEYGHAWSLYHAYIVQQDRDLLTYLEARGIDPDDDRLESSHAWSRTELIAEDYRQLFGSPEGRAAPQENRELPPAAEVRGLETFLRETFTQPPGDITDEGPGGEVTDEDDTDGSADDGGTDGSADDGGTHDGTDDGGTTDDEATGDGNGGDEAVDEGPVVISSPTDGAELVGDLVAVGTVTADFSRVDVTVDGVSRRAHLADDGTWTATFAAGVLPPGEHVLEAIARGPRGARTTATVTVTVVASGDGDGSAVDGSEDGASKPVRGNSPRR